MPTNIPPPGKRPRALAFPDEPTAPAVRKSARLADKGRNPVNFDAASYPPKRLKSTSLAASSTESVGKPATSKPSAPVLERKASASAPAPALTVPPGHEVAFQPLLDIRRRFPAICSDAGIRKVTRPVAGVGELADIDMNCIGVVKGKPGARFGIGTTHASSCVIVVSRALCGDGECAVALVHMSHGAQTKTVLKALAYAMLAEGASEVPLQLVGGAISRSMEHDDWLDHVAELLATVAEVEAELTEELGIAPNIRVVSAKLGTCETRIGDHGDDEPLLDSLAMPNSISVVALSDETVYADERPGKKSLFQSDGTVGVPVTDVTVAGVRDLDG